MIERMMTMPLPDPIVVWQNSTVTRQQREQAQSHRGVVAWLTGLPGSGKSTIAYGVEAQLHQAGYRCTVLDGDNIRHGLSADLGFSLADRNENVRRTGEVAKLLVEMGVIVLVALVSPVRSARDAVRKSMNADDFLEVYCQCPSNICQERDPKGMYAKVQQGLIASFTGISSPYEAPLAPNLTFETSADTPAHCVQRLAQFLVDHTAKESHKTGQQKAA